MIDPNGKGEGQNNILLFPQYANKNIVCRKLNFCMVELRGVIWWGIPSPTWRRAVEVHLVKVGRTLGKDLVIHSSTVFCSVPGKPLWDSLLLAKKSFGECYLTTSSFV